MLNQWQAFQDRVRVGPLRDWSKHGIQRAPAVGGQRTGAEYSSMGATMPIDSSNATITRITTSDIVGLSMDEAFEKFGITGGILRSGLDTQMANAGKPPKQVDRCNGPALRGSQPGPSFYLEDQGLAYPDSFQMSEMPEAGVYFLYANTPHGMCLQYVGQSVKPMARVHTHFSKGKISFDKFWILRCQREDVLGLETSLIRLFSPPMNDKRERLKPVKQCHVDMARAYGFELGVYTQVDLAAWESSGEPEVDTLEGFALTVKISES